MSPGTPSPSAHRPHSPECQAEQERGEAVQGRGGSGGGRGLSEKAAETRKLVLLGAGREREGGEGDLCYCQCVRHNYSLASEVIKSHYSHITWNKLFNSAFLPVKYCDNFRDHNLMEQ